MNINDTLRYLNIGLPQDILHHKEHGNFDEAIRLIDLRLQKDNIPQALRCCMIAQREIMCRLPGEYPYTRAEALALIRADIPDFTEEEFDTLRDNGRIYWLYVNGEMRYFRRFYDTLLKTEKEIAVRAGQVMPDNEKDTGKGMLSEAIQVMKAKGSLTKRIHIRHTIRLDDEHFTPGMLLRVHLPVAADCQQQSEIRIEKVWPESGRVDPADALQRTVFWEETMDDNHEFGVEYSYLHKAVYHDTSLMKGEGEQPSFDTEEVAPHITFTPYIRELVNTLTEGVTDPMEKARRFYDFFTLNTHYSFQPEYFVLENIPEGCARNFTGDCGVLALLFITLCRCAGIPAQWQSGNCAQPGDMGSHDWARFYVAPHGWLFADPSFGGGAVRRNNEEERRFYFGNLDPFRMVANRAFQAPFLNDKQHWRADPYDNQSGEMETSDRCFRFDEFTYTKEVLECVTAD